MKCMANGLDHKNHKMYRVVDVDGFVGSIQITEDADRQSLKDQVTVSLSEAADWIGCHGCSHWSRS